MGFGTWNEVASVVVSKNIMTDETMVAAELVKSEKKKSNMAGLKSEISKIFHIKVITYSES